MNCRMSILYENFCFCLVWFWSNHCASNELRVLFVLFIYARAHSHTCSRESFSNSFPHFFVACTPFSATNLSLHCTIRIHRTTCGFALGFHEFQYIIQEYAFHMQSMHAATTTTTTTNNTLFACISISNVCVCMCDIGTELICLFVSRPLHFLVAFRLSKSNYFIKMYAHIPGQTHYVHTAVI